MVANLFSACICTSNLDGYELSRRACSAAQRLEPAAAAAAASLLHSLFVQFVFVLYAAAA